MRCASCGEENDDVQRFCDSCGASLGAACPACGAAVTRPGAKFCGSCGAALPGAPGTPPASPPAPTPGGVAEIRLVSVLFNDLVGFTPLSETLPAEDVRELLSEYFAVAREVVGRYGGAIEKFIGDAVMAVFGAERATGDDGERAVRAGLDLVAAVRELGERRGLALAARAGICTGRAAVVAAEGEGLVTGDTVNTAARIQSAATPGEVFVDEATRSLAAAQLDLEPAGRFELKGKSSPVELFRAASAAPPRRGPAVAAATPFVGRSAELDRLSELAAACAGASAPRFVALVGAAGIGKSRLLDELAGGLGTAAGPTVVLRGQGRSFGGAVAFGALAGAVRGLFRLDGADSVATQRAELAARLPELVGGETAAWIEPHLALLLGLAPGARPIGRDELFGAWRSLLEQLASNGLVALLLDDAAGLDDGTLDFLDSLATWSRHAALFVCCAGREPLADRLADSHGAARWDRIDLGPLAEGELAALATTLAPVLADVVAARLVATAEGNPLFLLELLRSLADRGVLRRSGATYEPVDGAGPEGEIDLPLSLGALSAARLDALAPEERALVRELSVLGSTWRRSLASAVHAAGRPAELARLLDGLVERQVLAARRAGELAFSSELLRQVAYDRLTRRERRTLHLAAAEGLEATFNREEPELAAPESDEVGVVAAHYAAALEAVPEAADAPEVRRRAVSAFLAAGERERVAGHPAGAERRFLAAAGLAETGERALAGRAWELAGEAASVLGEYARAIEAFSRSAAIYDEQGADRAAARARGKQGAALTRSGKMTEGLALFEEARGELQLGTATAEAADLEWRYAVALLFDGRAAAAAAALERLLAMAEELGDPGLTVIALSHEGYLHDAEGDAERARACYAQAIEIGRTARLGRELANALSFANESYALDDRPEAAALGEESAELFRRLGDLPNLRVVVANLLLDAVLRGRVEQIAPLVADHLSGPGSEYVHAKLALYDCWRGDLEAARDHLEKAAGWEESGLFQNQAIYRIAQGSVALASGDAAGALLGAKGVVSECVERGELRSEELRLAWPIAFEAAVALGDTEAITALEAVFDHRSPGGVAPLLAAEHLRLTGRSLLMVDPESAAHLLAEAEARHLALGYPYFAGVAEIDHARAALVLGRAGEARSLLERAVGRLGPLDAAPALAEADHLLAEVGAETG